MSISVVGVVGAGFMGSGIAESAAAAGKHVVLYEPQEVPLERSREHLARSAGKGVSRGRLSQEEAERMIDRVLYTTRLEDLSGADGVIEAITEDARVKRELFARLDEQLPDAQLRRVQAPGVRAPAAAEANGRLRPTVVRPAVGSMSTPVLGLPAERLREDGSVPLGRAAAAQATC